MLKTIFFDLGNVLVFFSLPKMFEQISQCTGLSAEQIRKILFESDVRELYETGIIDTSQLHKIIQSVSQQPFSLEAFMAALSDIFTPNADLWPIVEKLKQNNLRLVLLSNTSECHFKHIESRFPVLRHFDHKVLSYEVGAWKPDVRIFQKALSEAQCAPQECFYTDDIPEFIQAARSVGLPGNVYSGVADLKEQLIERGCHFLT